VILLNPARAIPALATVAKGVFAMEGQHWIMLFIILVTGYVLGRLWSTPAQMVGLP
jgi:hypothetical protein